ncbi:hypothetical protein P879_07552 [Paragonimus westermani]|uniref:Neural proliferation differentiation and control protein 1 n=1 Tax=Paragonimus westermani TaxID=34504 RepID=A0A8T0D499_9TREM|nr:hypothetical protein P879_07552 [Paragonimus westermani]
MGTNLIMRRKKYHRSWIILVMVIERALGLTEHTPVPSSSKDTKLGSDLAIYLGVTIATALVVSTIFCSIWLLIILKGSRRRDQTSADSVLKDSPNSDDQKLATSAQRYHFEHQKQQMLSRNLGSPEQPVKDETDAEAEDIIYECPGLAATTKLEVTNPVFEMSLKKMRNE